jgi:hypothetical protein
MVCVSFGRFASSSSSFEDHRRSRVGGTAERLGHCLGPCPSAQDVANFKFKPTASRKLGIIEAKIAKFFSPNLSRASRQTCRLAHIHFCLKNWANISEVKRLIL